MGGQPCGWKHWLPSRKLTGSGSPFFTKTRAGSKTIVFAPFVGEQKSNNAVGRDMFLFTKPIVQATLTIFISTNIRISQKINHKSQILIQKTVVTMEDEQEQLKREKELRKKAEQKLAAGADDVQASVEKRNMQRMIHELQVHQVELEMQNEELMHSRSEIEQSRNDYLLLYQSAPVAYFTLDRNGVILSSNYKGSQLLGHTAQALFNKPFRSLLASSEGPEFYYFIKKIFDTQENYTCELTLINKSGQPIFAYLEGRLMPEQEDAQQCLLALIDITQRKKLEEETIQLKLQQQKEILNAILQGQEQERARMGEALHNGLAQVLYAAKLNLEILQSALEQSTPRTQELFQTIDSFLTDAIGQTRTLSHELIPVVIKDYGLEYALTELSKKLSNHELSIELDYYGFEQRLPQVLEVAVFRMVQELVNNIMKHARAKRATIEVFKSGPAIEIIVRDNGIGFDTERPSRKGVGWHEGVGLISVRNRVTLLNGTLHIQSQPGKGTQIDIQLPTELP